MIHQDRQEWVQLGWHHRHLSVCADDLIGADRTRGLERQAGQIGDTSGRGREDVFGLRASGAVCVSRWLCTPGGREGMWQFNDSIGWDTMLCAYSRSATASTAALNRPSPVAALSCVISSCSVPTSLSTRGSLEPCTAPRRRFTFVMFVRARSHGPRSWRALEPRQSVHVCGLWAQVPFTCM